MPPYQRDPIDPGPIAPTLLCDDAGVLWLGEKRLGHIDEADVPEGMEADYRRLLDDFRDSLEAGHEAEARYTYASTRGA